MAMRTQHQMVRVAHHDSGAEEWACPTCGRRLLLYAQPDLGSSVLAEGDAGVIHFGGLGALGASLFAAEAGLSADGAGGDDEIPLEAMGPWLKALKAIEDEGITL
jgi:hypothetical protein